MKQQQYVLCVDIEIMKATIYLFLGQVKSCIVFA